MTPLEKEFEATGYSAWVNSDLYPDNKVHTREYVNWLEKKLTPLEEGKPSEKWIVESTSYLHHPYIHGVFVDNEFLAATIEEKDANRIVNTITSLQSEVERLQLENANNIQRLDAAKKIIKEQHVEIQRLKKQNELLIEAANQFKVKSTIQYRIMNSGDPLI